MQVTVLGAGSWGTTVAALIAPRHPTVLWARNSTVAELLVVGVPTTAMRPTLHLAREWIHPWIPIVSLSKGLEQGSLQRMTEVIADEVPGHPVAALTGPNIAREI